MSDRAIPHLRKFLGQRLRELRKHRRLTQNQLGQLSSVSGRFIGEVERGEKSISIENLFALVSDRHRPADVRRAYEMLRAMLDGASSGA